MSVTNKKIGYAEFSDYLSKPVRRVGFGSSQVSSREFMVRVEEDVDLFVKAIRASGMIKGHILMLHGAGMDSSGFDIPILDVSFVDSLGRMGWDCWLVDYRGHGRSSRVRDGRSVSLDVVSADICKLLELLLPETDVHLLGESFGTMVALKVAASYKWIKSASLLGAIFSSLGEFESEFRGFLAEIERSSFCGYAYTTEEEWGNIFLRAAEPDVVRWHEVTFGSAYTYPVGPYLSAGTLPPLDAVDGIVCPVQMLVGSEDPFLDKGGLDRLIQLLPSERCHLMVLDGVGHLPYVERSRSVVAAQVDTFCMRVG